MKKKDLAHRLIHATDEERKLIVGTNDTEKIIKPKYCNQVCFIPKCEYKNKSQCDDLKSFYTLYKYIEKAKKEW